MTILTANEWDQFITNHAGAHLLQTTAWGEFKVSYGWTPVRLICGSASQVSIEEAISGAQILFRHLPFGLTMAYLPKGPVGTGGEKLWNEIEAVCRKRHAIFLKVEPDLWSQEDGIKLVEPSPPPGLQLSSITIQPPRTLIVDLTGDEERVLGRMKQKTRYNIKLAQKRGVVVHSSSDIDAFYRLMQVTGDRDQFGVHSLDYYRSAYELFHPRGTCELLMAEYQGEPLAGLMVFAQGQRSWFFYGASASENRDRMPTYLLQWEAMRWARGRNCTQYDLWGVPDEDEDYLEAHFTEQDCGLWGVYRFKRGFGGKLFRAAGPWDQVYHPALYNLYQWWAKKRKISQ